MEMPGWEVTGYSMARMQVEQKVKTKLEEKKTTGHFTGQKPWMRANWPSLVRPVHREATFH